MQRAHRNAKLFSISTKVNDTESKIRGNLVCMNVCMYTCMYCILIKIDDDSHFAKDLKFDWQERFRIFTYTFNLSISRLNVRLGHCAAF